MLYRADIYNLVISVSLWNTILVAGHSDLRIDLDSCCGPNINITLNEPKYGIRKKPYLCKYNKLS